MAKRGREAAPPADRAEGILLLNRWLKAVAALLGADAGCVVLNDGATSRVIARHAIPYAFMSRDQKMAALPYGVDEELVVRDATSRPELHAALGQFALARTGFFYRRPLSQDEARSITLLVFGETPRPNLGDRQLELAGEIADEMALEVERHYPLGKTGLAASMQLAEADIRRWMEGTDLPAVLLDEDLKLVSANAHMRTFLPLDWASVVGLPIEKLRLPAGESIAFLFQHALDANVSTPPMDLSLQDSAGEGLPRMLRVVGAPLHPVDCGPLLIATIDPRAVEAPPRALGPALAGAQEATAEFLLETLVRRRGLRSRKDVSYVTLRSWRQPIRTHQMTALKAVKRHAPQSLAAEIAAEMRDDIRSLFGAGGFKAVVPMPCSHSAPGSCLSMAIGQALARDLELPAAHALMMVPEKGSSHPKTNAKRPPMTLASKVEGPVLLIDDVATSGRHIEEATSLLRANGASVLAIAWIGGDADDKS
jgi:predicted amidophosphoribosyltransferase